MPVKGNGISVRAGGAAPACAECCAEKHEDMRWRLYDAALSLFSEKGYAATSVREIVKRAGVTAPVLYYYFGNKEGLYLELMGEALKAFRAVMTGARESEKSARERILAVSGGLVELCRSEVRIAKIINAFLYGPQQGAPVFDFDQFHDEIFGTVRSIVEEGAASGEFGGEHIEASVWALLGVIGICVDSVLLMPGREISRERMEEVFGVIFRGMEPLRKSGKRTGHG